ncbi:MAG: DUF1572 family protein [Phycisphaeraceae bacterium]|nr:DUF1572 family protein [Phycisphaeraceae bacterium]MCW5764204.1 DUF1572 family protein [Phycisphaeraceae bacterium]
MDAAASHYATPLPDDLIAVWRQVFERQQAFAEHAMKQLDDEGFFRAPGPGMNSIAIIVQHMAGNMLSRWTDFLTTDGEKPSRDRDAEFIAPEPTSSSRAALMARWNTGWAALSATLDALTPADLGRIVPIRSVPHPVHAAIARQLDHYAYHVGQINLIARLIVGTDRWQWFTIAPGATSAFNAKLFAGKGVQATPSKSKS